MLKQINSPCQHALCGAALAFNRLNAATVGDCGQLPGQVEAEVYYLNHDFVEHFGFDVYN
jgi:hypothetical protein